jgi:hypothetical protein
VAGRKQEDVIGIAKVADTWNHLNQAIHAGQVDIGKQASDGRAVRDAYFCDMQLIFLLVTEADALRQQLKEIVCGIDKVGQLRKQNVMIDAGEVVRDIALDQI